MKRREFIALVGVALAWVHAAQAQKSGTGMVTLGLLATGGAPGVAPPVFIEALSKLGYQQGKNLTIHFRSAKKSNAELPALAAELVNLKPDVLVALSTPPSLALKNATAAIPIVMLAIGDPVATGLVQSLAHPGGNVTGTANAVEEWGAKSLQMITEMLPGIRCLSYLRNSANQAIMAADEARRTVGKTLGMDFEVIDVSTPDQLDQALSVPPKDGCKAGLFIPLDALFISRRAQIAEYALRHNMALFASFREDAEAGALMAFGFNIDAQWRLGASYVELILKGAKPADLPVQRPVTFETVINLKTAKAIGVKVPTSLLLGADKVIE
jgi:putative ABC transport system substrate-binding protein